MRALPRLFTCLLSCLACSACGGAKKDSAEGEGKEAKAKGEDGAAEAPKVDAKPGVIVDGRLPVSATTALNDELILVVSTRDFATSTLISIGEGAPEVIARDVGKSHFATTDGSSIFWFVSEAEKASIFAVSPEGEGWSAPRLLTDAIPPDETRVWQMAVSDSHLYVPNGEALYRVAKEGGAPEQLEIPGHPQRVAVGGSKVYWQDIDFDTFEFTIYGAEQSEPSKAEAIVRTKEELRVFAVAGDTLYWTLGKGDGDKPQTAIMRQGAGGGAEELAVHDGESFIDMVAGRGVLGFNGADGVYLLREGSKELEKVEDKAGFDPLITAVGPSMIWYTGQALKTTPDAPFLKARAGALSADTLVGLVKK